MKLLLKIAYNGRDFCGWQVQPNGKTVQGEMSRAVEEAYGCKINVTGCSRTDSGVHALEYYCTLDVPENAPKIPVDRVPSALNVRLPESITVYEAKEVGSDFHARYSVKKKTYEYVIDNGYQRDPFLFGRAWHIKTPLDADKMNEVAKSFIGKHDFSAFMASGSEIEDATRTVFDAEVERVGSRVIFRVTADGFLYNMVRIMTGTLADVSCGRIEAGGIGRIIELCERKNAGVTAPADGLYLKHVEY